MIGRHGGEQLLENEPAELAGGAGDGDKRFRVFHGIDFGLGY